MHVLLWDTRCNVRPRRMPKFLAFSWTVFTFAASEVGVVTQLACKIIQFLEIAIHYINILNLSASRLPEEQGSDSDCHPD